VTRAGRGGPALVLIAAAFLAGCGGGDGDSGKVKGVGIARANSTAQFANCRDWRKGTVEQRYATIKDIRVQLAPQTPGVASQSDLPDETAYAMFQKTCAASFSDSLRLYKLYTRAQAYVPLRNAEPSTSR
jgi:hypothetical protein